MQKKIRLVPPPGQDADTEAFAQIYKEFAPKMRCFVSKVVARQSAYGRCRAQCLHAFVGEPGDHSESGIFGPLSFPAARNAIFDIYEHQKIVMQYERKSAKARTMFSIDEQINAENLAMMIELVIDRMPPQRQRIFRMSRYLGYSNSEIARHLNLSINTVNNHIVLALRELKAELETL